MPASTFQKFNLRAKTGGHRQHLIKMLAEGGISIESIQADAVRSGVSGKQTFKVEALQKELGTPASEMMLDIASGERQVAGS